MIFGGKRLIERYEEEIKHLREDNKELRSQILALTNADALWHHKNSQQQDELVEEPSWINPMGILENMEAKTKEEKELKKLAETQVSQMFGG